MHLILLIKILKWIKIVLTGRVMQEKSHVTYMEGSYIFCFCCHLVSLILGYCGGRHQDFQLLVLAVVWNFQ